MEKINIAELLKDCPLGMELDCAVFDNIVFNGSISNCVYPIKVITKDGSKSLNLTKYGCTSENKNAKCIIFPKGKTTWEGFQRPFKDGDIVAFDCSHRDNLQLFIFKDKAENDTLSFCYLMLDGDELDLEEGMYYVTRLATEEEKQKLFNAIKAKGYEWNPETKIPEKLVEPRFRVGDKVRHKDDKTVIIITGIKDNYYLMQFYNIRRRDYQNEKVSFEDQDQYELIPNKFDINTLVPFESKVLVRNSGSGFWKPAFWGTYEAERSNEHQYRNYLTTDGFFRHCIPYNDETKHLVGKTCDCPEYYKTWED